jgi:Family of unknown function (DUF5522)
MLQFYALHAAGAESTAILRENGCMDSNPDVPAIEPGDYYMEGANMVFTAAYHLKRGYCCGSKCRHCPYGFAADGAASPVDVAPPAG